MTSSIALEFLVFLAMDLVAPARDDDGLGHTPVRRGAVAAAARGDRCLFHARLHEAERSLRFIPLYFAHGITMKDSKWQHKMTVRPSYARASRSAYDAPLL